MELDVAPPERAVQILYEAGLLDDEGLAYARRVHSKLATPQPLLLVAIEIHELAMEDVHAVLRRHGRSLVRDELLCELGHVSPTDLQQAADMVIATGPEKRSLDEILVEHGFVAEQTLVELTAICAEVPYESPRAETIRDAGLPRLPLRWCSEHDFIPLRQEGDRVVVAFADPDSRRARAAAEEIYGTGRVEAVIAGRSEIQRALAHLEDPSGRASAGHEQAAGSSDVVALVDRLLRDAIERRASDIHIEPRKDRVTIRMREDGVLIHHSDLPIAMANPIASRIKVLCEADIAERRRHQGGRFNYAYGGGQLDLRVSIYVTVHGEKIVMRLLNHDRKLLSLSEIGMGDRMLAHFSDDALDRPSGVVLITGPTGSGKTTTLYSCVNHVRNDETSIITAEDPVEYVIDGIAQCSINPSIDLSFDETLRHIVRQDPDVIVIGEIRDTFSAEVAIQAALTGHKVFTTFHTEDTIGGLLRLLNMNIEAFLVSSTVVSVLAQRLLRRVCPDCAVGYQPTADDLRRLGFAGDALAAGDFRVGRGCDACRHTGYRGRIAAFELLVLDTAVRDAIIARQTSHQIRSISRESTGLVSLLEDGIGKAAAGHTTISEVVRMLPRLDSPRSLGEIRRLTE